jgi:Flp pilus assembly protein TadD
MVASDLASNRTGAPTEYRSLMAQAQLCLQRGDLEEARRRCNQAAESAPEQAEPYLGLGAIALQDHRLDEAYRAFQIARLLDGTCAGSRMLSRP